MLSISLHRGRLLVLYDHSKLNGFIALVCWLAVGSMHIHTGSDSLHTTAWPACGSRADRRFYRVGKLLALTGGAQVSPRYNKLLTRHYNTPYVTASPLAAVAEA